MVLWILDRLGHMSEPLHCCRASSSKHNCGGLPLNEEGYNHPCLLLEHYRNPEAGKEDITLIIVPVSFVHSMKLSWSVSLLIIVKMTSFKNKTILQTYTNSSPWIRSTSLPILCKFSEKNDIAKEMELLKKLNKPLLNVANGATIRQLYIVTNHIYRASLDQLGYYTGHPSEGCWQVRLDKKSYERVRGEFGLKDDESMYAKIIEESVLRPAAFNPRASSWITPTPPINPLAQVWRQIPPELDEATPEI